MVVNLSNMQLSAPEFLWIVAIFMPLLIWSENCRIIENRRPGWITPYKKKYLQDESLVPFWLNYVYVGD